MSAIQGAKVRSQYLSEMSRLSSTNLIQTLHIANCGVNVET